MTLGESPEGISSPIPEVESLLQEALELADGEEWEGVIDLLVGGLERFPGDAYLLCWLGLAEQELGEEGSAYDHFRQALEAAPEDPVLLATAGNALAAFDDPMAEGALRSAALLAPDLPQARWMYGAYLSREGMLEEALTHLEAAVALDAEDAVIHVELGAARALAGDLEQASLSFARATELAPEDGWPEVLFGLARFLVGELEEALGPIARGADLREDDVEAQLLSALLFAAGGWDARALEMLERARLVAGPGDRDLLLEVDQRIEEGEEAALQFLEEGFAAAALRERLMQRP